MDLNSDYGFWKSLPRFSPNPLLGLSFYATTKFLLGLKRVRFHVLNSDRIILDYFLNFSEPLHPSGAQVLPCSAYLFRGL
jgi:hypothetical protein